MSAVTFNDFITGMPESLDGDAMAIILQQVREHRAESLHLLDSFQVIYQGECQWMSMGHLQQLPRNLRSQTGWVAVKMACISSASIYRTFVSFVCEADVCLPL